MTLLPRRGFILGLGALTATAACYNSPDGSGGAVIDARADATLEFMLQQYPNTRDLMNRARGMLVMPLVTEAGIGFGGSYGRGALRIGQSTVDYYSSTSGSLGFQIGAHQYSHVLFFMTDDALAQFRQSQGWQASAEIDYALDGQGELLRADTTTQFMPVIAVVFAQSGLRVGASLEGTKYTRIIP